MHVALAFNLREESACETDQPPSDPPSEPPFQSQTTFTPSGTTFTRSGRLRAPSPPATRSPWSRPISTPMGLPGVAPRPGLQHCGGAAGQQPRSADSRHARHAGDPLHRQRPVTLGICLDKRRTKEILAYHRIPTPRFSIVQSLGEIPTRLRYPLLVKPTLEGSSKGVTDRALVRDRVPLFGRSTGSWAPTGNRHWWRSFFPDVSSPWPFWVTVPFGLPIVEINFDTLPEGVNPIYSYRGQMALGSGGRSAEIFSCPAPLEPLLRTKYRGNLPKGLPGRGLSRLVPY